jgi:hypothetical protein
VTSIPRAEQFHPAAFAPQEYGDLSIFAGVSGNPCLPETWIDPGAFFSRLPILPGQANPSLECREKLHPSDVDSHWRKHVLFLVQP